VGHDFIVPRGTMKSCSTAALENPMRIGITYDLKADEPVPVGVPDDFQEEFDSPATIEAIAGVLRGLGHDVAKLGDGRELLKPLLANPPDFVFNFAEGQGVGRCREARVPAVLEMLGIPFTGSDPLTLAVTLDKDCAKRLVQSAGVAVPRGWLIPCPSPGARKVPKSTSEPGSGVLNPGIGFPLIVKPAWEGSSKGIRGQSLVNRRSELETAIAWLQRDHHQPVLVEEYIAGDELTVGVIGNDPPRVIGIMRVLPRQSTEQFVYSLEVKRDYLRQVRYECPPPLPSGSLKAIEQAALEVYRVLGCRDVARIDFRLRDDVPYFLEANPLPGLNPESSDLVILARLCGWTYAQLIGSILQAALNRQIGL
jgi:D-alanine-D-alanine ligase